ncbi:MAG: dTMP kinase [Myxococcota bacterium]
MKRGLLVALEGLDGCGKSTQLVGLGEALRAAGVAPLLTREPTDGVHGRRIREMARSGEPVPTADELRWFVDDRAEHVAQSIAPALAEGRLVITDRYFLSTVAYQGARGLDWRELLSESEARFPAPDLALYLEVPVELGLARVRARGGVAEPVFERADYLEEVAKIFRAIERPYFQRIDASRSQREVQAELWEQLAVLRAAVT